MAVSLTYDEVRTSVPPSQFTATYTVTSAIDIPEEVFLLDALDPGTFLRVALVGDFGYPTTPDPNVASFYRSATAVLEFTEFSAAEAGAVDINDRISTLVTDYQTGTDAWDGSQSITVPP